MKKHHSSHHGHHDGHHKSHHSPKSHHHADGHHHSGSMSHLGDHQGDMKPHVMDIQRPDSSFPEHDFSGTTNYVERQNRTQERMSKDIKSQAYQGRYS
jgi:hypothetical protein